MPVPEYITSILPTIIYDFLKERIPSWFSKGVVLDFMEPFDLRLGAGFSDYMPTKISLNLSLDAWNDDQKPNLLQKIAAELQGLEDTEWTSNSGTTFEYNTDKPTLPRSLPPGEHLPIGLKVNMGFGHHDADKFVEQFVKLKNKRLGIKVVYMVKEGAKTKTKELEKADINFYESFYPSYKSYLCHCSGNEKARKLLDILQVKES